MKRLLIATIAATMLLFGLSMRSASASAVVWSVNAASCVPTSTTAANDIVSAGSVSANTNSAVILYCALDYGRLAALAYNRIEIVSVGNVVGGTNPAGITAELIEMDRSTGAETSLGAVSSTSSSSVHTNFSSATGVFSPNIEVYYVRITIKSGIAVGSSNTLYSVALTFQ